MNQIQTKNTNTQTLPFSWIYFFGGICAFFLMGAIIFYIVCINMLATRGYTMNSLEKEIQMLYEEQKEMSIEEAGLASLYRIREKSDHFGLESVQEKEIIYNAGQFALKD
jgi:hypothetical protein